VLAKNNTPYAFQARHMTKKASKLVAGRKSAVPHANRLLGLLLPEDYERLRPHLQPVSLKYRQSLYRAHRPIGFAYFIETGVGSLVKTMANGEAAEVGTIGSEGVVGLPLLLGEFAPAAKFEGFICKSYGRAGLRAMSQACRDVSGGRGDHDHAVKRFGPEDQQRRANNQIDQRSTDPDTRRAKNVLEEMALEYIAGVVPVTGTDQSFRIIENRRS
jgi:hypothetical protein